MGVAELAAWGYFSPMRRMGLRYSNDPCQGKALKIGENNPWDVSFGFRASDEIILGG